MLQLPSTGRLPSARSLGPLEWPLLGGLSDLAAALNATAPLFAILVAHVWSRDERMSPARLGALRIGFAGVVPVAAGATDLLQVTFLIAVRVEGSSQGDR